MPLAVKIVAIVAVVWSIAPDISLFIVAWIATFFVFNILYARWKFKYDVAVAAIDSRTTGYLADAITNHNTIQLFTGQAHEERGFGDITGEQARMTNDLWNIESVVEAVQGLLIFIAEFFLFYYTIIYWERGIVGVGTFVLFQSYLIGLGGQLWDFSRVTRDAYQGYADAKEMVEIMRLPHEIKDAAGAVPLVVREPRVVFDHVSFGFGNAKRVLKDIGLEIAPGERIGIVGPSGAGKTTFVRLLLRLYAPSAGAIRISGSDIARVTQKSLRDAVAMVPQDPVLFHRTLAENIAYGKRGAAREDIERAGRLAHCDEFVKNLPEGYETYVGERGIKLSGGERQRVAIARAILKNAPILLLDEATSSLDSHSEHLIQEALDELMKGKTSIVIAHRLSTIRKMDRVVIIENGRIADQGTHDELIAKGGLYAELWNLQAGGFLGNGSARPKMSA